MGIAIKSFVFPGNIESEVLSLAADQVPYARTSQFSELILSCEKDMLSLIECNDGKVIPLTASGTAAMEAVVANVVGPKDRVLAINGGCFGQRWCEIVLRYPHANLDVYEMARVPDYEDLQKIILSGGYDVVLLQHHETSTGELYDVRLIGESCRAAGSLCVVDAISSFLADPFSMNAMSVDIAILSSHKGLCLPPGLSFVVLGARALDRPLYQRGLYLDFKKNLESLKRGQTLYSPAVLLFVQLRRRLDLIDSAASVVSGVREKAQAFRNCLHVHGRDTMPFNPSNCLTSFRVNCDGLALCRDLESDGWFVMPSRDPDQIRVAHLGQNSVADHQSLYTNLCAAEQRLSEKK